MAKVVHLTSVHPPLDPRIFQKECRTLAKAGHEVVLIAPGEADQTVDGVRIRAVPRGQGRLGRVLDTTRAVYRAALDEDAALYHFHDPELIGVGLQLKRRGKRVIYDVHEDLPRQVMSKHWIPGLLRGGVSQLAAFAERVAAMRFDAFVAATPHIAARFPAARTIALFNYPWLEELRVPSAAPYASRQAIAFYAGAIYSTRGATEMVEAIAQVAEPDARLHLAGTIRPPELEAALKALPGWERTEFLGWLDRAGVGAALGRARVGLVTLHATPSYLESYPIKLFEYMAAGIPFVASDFPLWRELVGDLEAGQFVDPRDPGAIATAIQALLADPAAAEAMGARGRAAVESRFNWEAESGKLLALYEQVLAR